MGESKQVSRRIRRRTLGTAFRADPRREPDPQLQQMGDVAWTVRDISLSGAFLATGSPVAVSAEFSLTLVFGVAMLHVRVEVVRVQEPAWGRTGGVGVIFKQFGPGAKKFLESYIAAAEGNVY